MRFVEENITKNNSGLEQALTLDARRPDLARIRLDCHNTSDLIPYIDLINEVLEAIVTREFSNPRCLCGAGRDVFSIQPAL